MDQQLRVYAKHIATEENKILVHADDFMDVHSTLERLEGDRNRLLRRRSAYTGALSLADVEQLEHVRANKFIELRVNTLAIKTRMRDRLRQQKFEFSWIEQNVHVQSSGEL
jgi:hypothetical protein